MRTTVSAAIISGALICSGGTAAMAADLLLEPEPIVDVATTWTDGLYIGVHGGFGAGIADHQPLVAPPGFPNGYDINLSGALIGGQIGGWWHITDGIMGGIQLDADWTNITGSLDVGGGPGVIDYTINWIATAEGRLGFDAGGWVPYVALGVAAAGGTRTTDLGTASAVHPGLSVGAGAQFMLTDQLSADIEGRWQGFGPQTYDTGGTPPSIALGVGSIRAGLNFHF